jgi:hypothetical protein
MGAWTPTMTKPSFAYDLYQAFRNDPASVKNLKLTTRPRMTRYGRRPEKALRGGRRPGGFRVAGEEDDRQHREDAWGNPGQKPANEPDEDKSHGRRTLQFTERR